MSSRRIRRVSDQIQREIADILARKVQDPRITFVTVTGARVSPDLRHARILVSVLGNETKQQEALEALKGAAGFIQVELGRRLSMKFTPRLIFERDQEGEKTARLLALLDQVGRGGNPEEGEG